MVPVPLATRHSAIAEMPAFVRCSLCAVVRCRSVLRFWCVDATHGAEGEWSISSYVIIEAPSILGLFPGGVERLPEALLAAGLADRLGARHGGRVSPPPYDSRRDTVTGLLNPTGLRDYAHLLAAATGDVLDRGEIPIVLGGDCSILLGNLLALSRRGRHGLLFIDGHADFYQPEAEPRGEAASMDLALATGRGPSVLADLEGRGPLVRDEDVAVFGRRDAAEAEQAGSQRIEDTAIAVVDLATIRERGAERAARDALAHLRRPETRRRVGPPRLRRRRRRPHAGSGLPTARWPELDRIGDGAPTGHRRADASLASRSPSSTRHSTPTAPSPKISSPVSFVASNDDDASLTRQQLATPDRRLGDGRVDAVRRSLEPQLERLSGAAFCVNCRACEFVGDADASRRIVGDEGGETPCIEYLAERV